MEFEVKPNARNQVTLPPEVSLHLGVEPGDKVSFVIDGDVVRLERWQSVVARTAGILKSDVPFTSIEHEKRAFEEAVVEDVIRRSTHS